MIAATKNGIDVDITREVLQELGYKVNIEFAPLKRSMRQVIEKKADLFLPSFFQNDSKEFFLSIPFIRYRPTAFSLKNHNFIFKKIEDLTGKQLITFQGATGYFGDEFVKISKLKSYRELHDMSKLPEMLIKKRCEVVVLDYYIFHYFLKEYLKLNPNESFAVQELEEFRIFPEVNAHVVFHDKRLRNKFNKQLKLYKKNKRHEAVITKYIGM
jgi:ABC-type amino acid transport substrate-binding protein